MTSFVTRMSILEFNMVNLKKNISYTFASSTFKSFAQILMVMSLPFIAPQDKIANMLIIAALIATIIAFIDNGVNGALIRLKHISDGHHKSALICHFCYGCVLNTITYFAFSYLDLWYNESFLSPTWPYFSLLTLLTSLSLSMRGRLEQKKSFKTVAVIEFFSTLTIIVSFFYFCKLTEKGITDSIILECYTIGSVSSLLLYSYHQKNIYKIILEKPKKLKYFLRYTKNTIIASVSNIGSREIEILLAKKYIEPNTLAILVLYRQISLQMQNLINPSFYRVYLPYISHQNNNKEKSGMYFNMLRILFPIYFCLHLLLPLFLIEQILYILQLKSYIAQELFIILSFGYMLRAIGNPYGILFKAFDVPEKERTNSVIFFFASMIYLFIPLSDVRIFIYVMTILNIFYFMMNYIKLKIDYMKSINFRLERNLILSFLCISIIYLTLDRTVLKNLFI